jgi:hypothetical protein
MAMRRTVQELRQLTAAYRLSQVVYAFTSLGMADALAGGAKTANDVAETVRTAPGPTDRLLRAAAGEGVIDVHDGRYSLNEFSELLVSGVDGSLADMVMGWTLLPITYAAFGRLDEAVRTGRSGVELAFGARFHELLRTRPDDAARYEAAMESTVEGFRVQAELFDFSRYGSVVDVGGGQGSFLVAILRRYPDVDATLFDLPDVVRGAPAPLAAHPEGDQIDVVAGNMFDDVPAGFGVYLFSTVLRCFTDDECLSVLGRCRERMAPGGRVLAVEMVMPDDAPSPHGLADLQALVVYGGADRTETEWTELFRCAGLADPVFTPADAPFVLIEAALP